MRSVSNPDTYRTRLGAATLTSVSSVEIAKLLGRYWNSKKLQEVFKRERVQLQQDHNCVTAATLLLMAEHVRIGAAFETKAYESVATVFRHAYAEINHVIEIVGDPAKIAQITKDEKRRVRLAEQLTGRPGGHQYIYLTGSKRTGTALSEDELSRADCGPTKVIDLKMVARRLCKTLARPLLTLYLKPSEVRS